MNKKYDWDGWIDRLDDGQVLVLTYGEDYDRSQATMCQAIRNAACQRDISVKVEDMGAYIVVTKKERKRRARPTAAAVTG